MADARFEDGVDAPLRLIAQDAEGLGIFSALLQDAVFPINDMTYARGRRFALILNRFRWEDRLAAEAQGRAYERVRSLLVFENVLSVRTSGIDRAQGDTILSLLQIAFAPGVEGAGMVTLILAGDGAIQLEVEAVEAQLNDVTQPYAAPSRKMPQHRD
jgi:hypothetical protein